ncbi:MAG TPA: SAM-dependent methyltransferase [Algoriphagus sp.]|jgi:16S rRNA (cytidine1402-2'-O)-methyltransferase|uniref:SAM-dependent methyltransferase n=1 Tax=unclassified Algoriphagus TaxID=2641541 RepID=UPI000C3E623D|nr:MULTISPECIES: SAM-dependent methyltransferase [unclassified Algoriphagus]MAL12290.1 SAM-dependent methyltransferase [Algoriphagus sp.]MAN88575.1 SAM-dependent methyltransferase [Algoriphagus sp.]HAD51035.1 SAM-dependent methyltransferase [Algoriphagus sp.]HAS58297.1 SAM-dependent methyltransferase [Algoriphagus sp.]HCD87961.1 SAM-dependent methyltransferase [Algoriphagus sp.]|tara:strand:+ start:2084 stop:2794 length:711 start_codon:yes stop_codon:yes gene_type:complete
MPQGKLFLIPNVLAENTADAVITPQVKEVIAHTKVFLVENLRTARRYISSLKLGVNLEEVHMEILDKNTTPESINRLLQPLFKGADVGIISEAGCPGIADPGALAVAHAHARGIQVVPLSGPSSMFLALMGSGFSGQSFAFHGYLPIDKKERNQALRKLEAESAKEHRAQIFMETPFRNNQLLEDALAALSPQTKLCIAKNLTAADELIQTKTISDWKKNPIDLHKIPTVFILQSF